MSIVSVYFFLFVLGVLVAYYVMPKCCRWCVILIANIVFCLLSSIWKLLCIAILSIVVTYGVSNIVDVLKKKEKNRKLIAFCVACGVIINLIILVAFKEINFFINNTNKVISIFSDNQIQLVIDMVAPLGISYYTLTMISYLMDSYWGLFEVQKNPFKLIAYILYFPTLTSGPIMRYSDMKSHIYDGNKLEYKNICYGAQRIVWGIFKKLVIADRLAPFVNAMQSEQCEGLYVFVGVICYALQLYMDFSACMDIIIGVSELFGIKLPENFNTPLYATNLSEYWRRWHITLGLWVRDYVMNPVLKSKSIQKLGKKTKKKLGKKWGKRIPVWIGMFCTWFCVGFWHGGTWTFIFGSGLFFFVMIVGSQILEPVWKWLIKLLHINTKSIVWLTWQRIRTFILFSASISFSWAASMSDAFALWKRGFSVFNPEVLFNGDLFQYGLDGQDMLIVLAGLLIVLAVSIIQQKESVRDVISKYNIVVRWAIFIVLICFIIVFGTYGKGYNAGDFIYGAF